MARTPYTSKPESSFWRPAVAKKHYMELENLWRPAGISSGDKFATAGSCFAQHIGNHLVQRGARFLDLEPAPAIFDTADEARRWGFGIYSCRYGNIYTSRQLLQLFDEAFGFRDPEEKVWQERDRFFDALRPGIDPVGQDSAEAVVDLRRLHLQRVREMFEAVDVFVFTMGLTEGWELRSDQTMFPTAPGTIAGRWDRRKYRFRNLSYRDVYLDMKTFWDRLRDVNPTARMLLTVSPVPLTATATSEHVLVASSYSKAVLRAAAGDLAKRYEGISYFPSYEIISSHPSRSMFYNPDLRTVNAQGVKYVMEHFFSGTLMEEFQSPSVNEPEEIGLICDEEKLDRSW